MLCVCGSETASEKIAQALTTDRSSAQVHFTRVPSILDALGELAKNPFDVVLAEIRAGDGPGMNTADELRRYAPGVPLILISSAADRDAAIAAVRGGARDFFMIEDLDSEALRRSVRKALEIDKGKQATGEERRSHARFPCRLAITWRTLEQPIKSGESSSETVNISSKGILFATGEQFEPGQLLQVSLDWPARLGNEVPLKLVAEGRVLRNAQGKTAISIERYEFRTRRGSSSQPPPVAVAAPPGRATGTLG